MTVNTFRTAGRVAVLLVAGTIWIAQGVSAADKVFRAGAAIVDIAPAKLPVIVNGYTFERTADRVVDQIAARALVLDDGQTQAAICVVDVCVIPRTLADRAKQLAHSATGIPIERMLISATHTHSAPSVMEALGSREDPEYAAQLPGQIAAAIEQAYRHREPARVGWTVTEDRADTNCRLWIMTPGNVPPRPWGEPGKRILMCPPYQGPHNIGPAGPVDAGLTLLSVQSPAGRPIALLANYGMHFYHATPLSADWCGEFARQFEKRIGGRNNECPFVAIMSQGTAGDQHYMDYSRPEQKGTVATYAASVVQVAYEAFERIHYEPWAPLAMSERKLTLAVRRPPADRLAWARPIAEKLGDRLPRTREEVYAREQILFAQTPPQRELRLQALRIGSLGITAIPCEVYGVSGLKIKRQSPLVPTMNIELANGEEGYIPPPAQHALGGYSTWEARTSCLEVQAEPQIVDTVLSLLEEVAGQPRRPLTDPLTPYAQAVLASRPAAYWRLEEMNGPTARDALGHVAGHYEDGIAFYLDGPDRPGLTCGAASARAAHFAGGRMSATLPALGNTYSVEMWIWNGLPTDFRDVTGWIVSRGGSAAGQAAGDSLGIGGKGTNSGRLIFSAGRQAEPSLTGRTPLDVRAWHHVLMVRDGRRVVVYLDGERTPELAGDVQPGAAQPSDRLFVGGRSDGGSPFEGKLCEVAVYGRALSADDAHAHWSAAGAATTSSAAACATEAASR